MPPQERRHEGFLVWGIFLHALERRDENYALFVFLVLWGALLPFVLRVVAGACVGRGAASHSHAAAGAAARGGFLFGGFRTSGAATAVTENTRRELFHPRCRADVLRSGASHSLQWGVMPAWRRRFRNDDGLGVVVVWTEGICRRKGLTTGVVRHACRLRRDGTRGFWFCSGGADAVCFGEAIAGDVMAGRFAGQRQPMPQRGRGSPRRLIIFWFGGFFHTLRSGLARERLGG